VANEEPALVGDVVAATDGTSALRSADVQVSLALAEPAGPADARVAYFAAAAPPAPADVSVLVGEAPLAFAAPAHATIVALPKGAPPSADVEPAATPPDELFQLPFQVARLVLAAATFHSARELRVAAAGPLHSVLEPQAVAGLESPCERSLLPGAARMALWVESAFWWQLLADLLPRRRA
jgi:hypothetical protein